MNLRHRPARDAYQLLFKRQAHRHRRRVAAFFSEFVRPGELVFDIGANDGRYTDVYMSLGARVVAVEPNPVLATRLRRRYRGAEVVEAAIGAGPGSADLHLGTSDILSTLSKRWISKAGEAGLVNTWTGETIRVEVSTLDALIARFGAAAYAKIDVEGYEPEVLGGLSSPLPAASFEVQLPMLELTEECVRRLDALGRYEYNVSFADRYSLEPEWTGSQALLEALDRARSGGVAHGDVFARLT